LESVSGELLKAHFPLEKAVRLRQYSPMVPLRYVKVHKV
jgi:hypothetical protein